MASMKLISARYGHHPGFTYKGDGYFFIFSYELFHK